MIFTLPTRNAHLWSVTGRHEEEEETIYIRSRMEEETIYIYIYIYIYMWNNADSVVTSIYEYGWI